MRVLFTTFAWPSHYYPMVPLAWALRAAGHEVRMTSQPDLLPTLRASGLPVTAVGQDVDFATEFREAAQRLPPTAGHAAPREPRPGTERYTDHLAVDPDNPHQVQGLRVLRQLESEMWMIFEDIYRRRRQRMSRALQVSPFGEIGLAMAEDLLALARAWRADVIVYDPMTYAGPLVARLLGVPAVRNLFGPDVTYFQRAARWAENGLLDRFGLDELDLHGAASIDPCPPELQLPQDIAPTTRWHIRHIPYPGLAEVPAWLSDQSRRPRMCLTWGTSIHRLLGAKAFLAPAVLHGAARLAAQRNAELVLAITAGQRHLVPVVPANVRVVESVPLDALLPTCQILIHQGGAGTMLTGLGHAIPQLILPHIFDEAANAFQLVAAGAAIVHAAAEVTATEIVSSGHRLLDDPVHAAAAQRLRAQIHAQATPAELVRRLSALRSEMVAAPAR